MRIANRMSKIDSSGIRKVFDLASRISDPVNLSIGQPHFTVPGAVKKKALEAIGGDRNRYTLTQGIPELRSLVETYYRNTYGFKAEASVITSGVSGGLLLALTALVEPGDEVLIPDPYFVMYKHLVGLMGGVPVFYDLYPDFQVREKALRSRITPKTRILIVNSPSNPTGAVCTTGELKLLAGLAGEHGLFILSDEIYDDFIYDGPKESISQYTDNVCVLNGFSKSMAATGWRVGYALGKEELIREMIKLQQYSFVCAPSFAQYALLESENVDRASYRDDYRKKRDMLCGGLKDLFDIRKPGGAFYVFPAVPEGYASASAFVEKAIGRKLLIIPGNVFSERDTHFRISFAAEDAVIEKGIEILRDLAKSG